MLTEKQSTDAIDAVDIAIEHYTQMLNDLKATRASLELEKMSHQFDAVRVAP